MAPKKSSFDSSPNSVENRLREEAPGIMLPAFDTLPAAAGLDNAEAFRLSQRHALALLPGMLARGLVLEATRKIRIASSFANAPAPHSTFSVKRSTFAPLVLPNNQQPITENRVAPEAP